MTDDRINEIFQSVANDDPDVHLRFARAILRATLSSPVAEVAQGVVTESDALKVINGMGYFTDFPDDIQRMVELLTEFAASRAPVAVGVEPEIAQLMKFYSVSTLEALARAQSRHVARLQAKLPRDTTPAFQRVREG